MYGYLELQIFKYDENMLGKNRAMKRVPQQDEDGKHGSRAQKQTLQSELRRGQPG
jgi:hypothetical protein